MLLATFLFLMKVVSKLSYYGLLIIVLRASINITHQKLAKLCSYNIEPFKKLQTKLKHVAGQNRIRKISTSHN